MVGSDFSGVTPAPEPSLTISRVVAIMVGSSDVSEMQETPVLATNQIDDPYMRCKGAALVSNDGGLFWHSGMIWRWA